MLMRSRYNLRHGAAYSSMNLGSSVVRMSSSEAETPRSLMATGQSCALKLGRCRQAGISVRLCVNLQLLRGLTGTNRGTALHCAHWVRVKMMELMTVECEAA